MTRLWRLLPAWGGRALFLIALGLANGHRHFLSCLPNNETLLFEDLDLQALDGCARPLFQSGYYGADATNHPPSLLDTGGWFRSRSFTAARD